MSLSPDGHHQTYKKRWLEKSLGRNLLTSLSVLRNGNWCENSPLLFFFIAKIMGQREDTHGNQTKGEVDGSLTPLNGDVQPERQAALLSALQFLTLTQQAPATQTSKS